MAALKITGIFFAVIILIIVILLSLRIYVIIKKDKKQGLCLYFRILGITFGKEKKGKKQKKGTANDKKQKKTQKEKEDNFLVTAVLRLFGLSHLEKNDDNEEKQSLADTVENLKETVRAISLIINKVFWAARHSQLRKLHLIFISGGEDAAKAAMDYGIACSALYPLLGMLLSYSKKEPRSYHVEIKCDFDRQDTEFEFDAEISLRAYYLFRAALKIVKQNIADNRFKE